MQRKPWIICLALALSAAALPAYAALGGSLSSAAVGSTAGAQSKTTLRTDAGSNYTRHETTTAAGTLVRQFVSADGRVFAVAWSGPAKPDLRELLGTYFADFTDARDPTQRSHGQRRLENADLVVQSGGRMRAFSGRAYLPSKLPTGVLLDDLR